MRRRRRPRSTGVGLTGSAAPRSGLPGRRARTSSRLCRRRTVGSLPRTARWRVRPSRRTRWRARREHGNGRGCGRAQLAPEDRPTGIRTSVGLLASATSAMPRLIASRSNAPCCISRSTASNPIRASDCASVGSPCEHHPSSNCSPPFRRSLKIEIGSAVVIDVLAHVRDVFYTIRRASQLRSAVMSVRWRPIALRRTSSSVRLAKVGWRTRSVRTPSTVHTPAVAAGRGRARRRRVRATSSDRCRRTRRRRCCSPR